MKITKTEAVTFLVALGFSTAAEWDVEKLRSRLEQVPTRLAAKEVPASFLPMYEELSQAEAGSITVTADNGEEVTSKSKKGSSKPAAKSEKSDKSEKSKPAAKGGKGDKPAKSEKPDKEDKVEKPEKKAKKEKPEREVDAYGSAPGTVRAKVNAAFSKDWMTDDETAQEAGVTIRQARIRLRRAVKSGLLEKRRRIEYRLLPVKK